MPSIQELRNKLKKNKGKAKIKRKKNKLIEESNKNDPAKYWNDSLNSRQFNNENEEDEDFPDNPQYNDDEELEGSASDYGASFGGKRKSPSKKKIKKTKKKRIRKHAGINQTTGKLKKGYKYSGKKLKSGLKQIIKVKKN